ncbi:MAG: hypothetical protein QGG42_14490 [Phycisphaerae bacterium]|jgi:hypothetical protein|nr:hypothetical protein [Phycisphaerae bacterium]
MDQKAPKKPGGKKYWWAGGIVCAILVIGLLAGWIYVAGRRVWTDGRDIVAPVSTANVRQVLWSVPEPMTAEFNTPGDEYEICLSSDSNELYFVRGRPEQGADIFTSRRTHNKWSKPVRLEAVNSKYDELGPRLSEDGKLLLFYSNRPGGIGGYDVWVARRTDGVWGRPVNLGPNVNSPHNEYGASITADNRMLYFASNRKAAERMGKRTQWRATIRQAQLGDYDLFSAEVDFSQALPTTATSRPTTAPAAGLSIRAEQALELQGVNTLHNEGAPCISPWGDFLYFASNRPGGRGGFDLYRVRIEDGRCVRLENLGAEVNTAGNETDPQLTKGGFMLYFSSDRDGGDDGTYDLYTSQSHEVYATRIGRPLPTLGWSVWVLLGSLLLIIPLMLFLRAGGYKHLSMLQKCFVVALVLHLLLTLGLSLAQVSQDIYKYVIDAPQEVSLDLTTDTQLEERTQIRHQLADLTPAAPRQTEIVRQDTEFQPIREEIKRIDMDVPEERRAPVEYIRDLEKPKDDPKIDPPQVVTPRPTVHMPELAIKLTPPEIKVRSIDTESQVAPTPPSDNQIRRPSAIVKTVRPDAASIPTEPTKAVVNTLASVAEVSRPVGQAQMPEYTPTPKLTEMHLTLSPPKRSSKPVQEVRANGVTDVTVNKPTGAERKQTSAPAAKAGSARVTAPAVQADSESMMTQPGPMRADRPVGQAVEQADTPTPKVVDVAIHISGPKIKPSENQASPEPTNTAQADQPAGSSRAAASKPTSTAGSAKLAMPSVEPSGASLAMTGAPAKIDKPLGEVSPQAALPVPVIAPAVISPSAPRIKAAGKQAEENLTLSAIPSPKSLPAGPVRSTGSASKADLTHLTSPSVRSSQDSLASALTITHRVAKASDVRVSVNIPLPSDAPEVGSPAPPSSVASVNPEAAVGRTAEEAKTSGIGKVASVTTPLSGRPEDMRSDTQTHEPSTVSVVQKASPDRPDRTAYNPQPDLARPLVAIGPIGGALGPPKSAKPEVMFHRKFEQRQRLLKEMGGTKASEAAVARALLYLSRTQEKDGAWGYMSGKSRRHRRKDTDVAMTGLSALCFLAGDHTPTKNGPYRDTVTKAIDYLVEQQGKDGGLWQNGSRMYGHAIATLALSEAAIMTGDAKYRQAAIKGAQYIIKAQHPSNGGWRYKPRESGDTSVLGWCVMALYSVQRMGMEIPPKTLRGAHKWMDKVSGGRTGILCGYTDRRAKPAMSAEGAFSRMLLGRRPSDAQQKELAAYMHTHRKETAKNFYLAYYGSLAMMQLGGDAWSKWNPEMRERLVALQTRGGSMDGAWTNTTAYSGNNAGVIYTTTMATLTLEVYYRYLPMLGGSTDESSDSGGGSEVPDRTKSRREKRR